MICKFQKCFWHLTALKLGKRLSGEEPLTLRGRKRSSWGWVCEWRGRPGRGRELRSGWTWFWVSAPEGRNNYILAICGEKESFKFWTSKICWNKGRFQSPSETHTVTDSLCKNLNGFSNSGGQMSGLFMLHKSIVYLEKCLWPLSRTPVSVSVCLFLWFC